MADKVAKGPHDTGDDSKGAAHAAPSGKDASHGPEPVGGEQTAARTRPSSQSQEPLGVVGGLMLLGALALTVAAGNSRRIMPRVDATRSKPAAGHEPH